MPLFLHSLTIAALSVVVQTTPPPPPPLPTGQVAPQPAHRPDRPSTQPTANRNAYARDTSDGIGNPQAYVRQLFSRFPERIVDVEERHSGPGAFLVGVTLYERPEAHHIAGLCKVRVHEVSVNTAPPPHNPPRHAEAVRTSTRFLAIGPVNSTIPPADQRQRCESLPSARNFFRASEDDARLALQALTDARYFATSMPRAISFTCNSYQNQCAQPSQLFIRHLTPDRVRSVERISCADGTTDIDNPCFRISFGFVADLGGDWTVTTHGLRRPVRIHLEQAHPPVA